MTNISANTPRLPDTSIGLQQVGAQKESDAIALAKSQLYSLGLEEELQNQVNSLQASRALGILGIDGNAKPQVPDLVLADRNTRAAEEVEVLTQTVKAMTSLLEDELQISKPSTMGLLKPDLTPFGFRTPPKTA
ncbi:hypothetical protein [Ottowia thiooxydans]|uniref:hypothetical protein n=1 Tax=Ottowia thiooxydans TaxID=219182 RepID=UPI00040895DE|nr:hypothetical protein [Ottowia thiooxydans]